MIDLHSHILPGLDDGPADIETSVAMARMAVQSGTEVMACTPHIVPGLWENDAGVIRGGVEALQRVLDAERIGLRLCVGADVHIAPGLGRALEAGDVPTLGGSRYFLLELPRHVPPPRTEYLVGNLMAAGFVPVLTHLERMDWFERHYGMIERLNAAGCLIQVTAGSVTGRFGRRARDRSSRLLDEGRVDIVASDTHNPTSRPPSLGRARDMIAERLGAAEADAMVSSCPAAVLADAPLEPRGTRGRPSLREHRTGRPVVPTDGLASRIRKRFMSGTFMSETLNDSRPGWLGLSPTGSVPEATVPDESVPDESVPDESVGTWPAMPGRQSRVPG